LRGDDLVGVNVVAHDVNGTGENGFHTTVMCRAWGRFSIEFRRDQKIVPAVFISFNPKDSVTSLKMAA
jgi:hypothetical protein